MTRASTADRQRRDAHADFLSSGQPATAVRSVVAESWIRSSAAGVDPDAQLAPVVLEPGEVVDYRAAHPLSQVFPLLYDVLGRAAVDCDCVMAVGDAEGKLLWVCGPPGVLRKAEAINFVEGSVWDEHHAGTNAPGTALHLDQAVQIASAEHFNRLVQSWSCSAAPIHHPHTHEILGLVDITGGPDVASPQTLGMVRAAARMAESELARLALESGAGDLRAGDVRDGRLWAPPSPPGRRVLRIRGLGLPDCVAELGARTHRLSPRHSEILVVLVDHPEGLTAEQLELEVYAADVHSSTMRAEMTRLRGLLGPGVLQSRPYRLVVETECDWQAASAQVRRPRRLPTNARRRPAPQHRRDRARSRRLAPIGQATLRRHGVEPTAHAGKRRDAARRDQQVAQRFGLAESTLLRRSRLSIAFGGANVI